MHKKALKRGFFAVIALSFAALPAVLFFLPQPATGTDVMMRTLPAYERFQCALCHTTPTPVVGQAELNVFGVDFLANSAVWDRTLALKNSDGDRCSNGTEIGDRDGDGEFDDGGNRPRENANPGNPSDCTAPIDEATWGIIKEIFSNEFEQYILVEPEWEYFAMYFKP